MSVTLINRINKPLYWLLVILISMNIISVGLNVYFIYFPEIQYRTEIEKNVDEFKTVIHEIQSFVEESQPVIVSIRAMICKYEPEYCPSSTSEYFK